MKNVIQCICLSMMFFISAVFAGDVIQSVKTIEENMTYKSMDTGSYLLAADRCPACCTGCGTDKKDCSGCSSNLKDGYQSELLVTRCPACCTGCGTDKKDCSGCSSFLDDEIYSEQLVHGKDGACCQCIEQS